VPLRFGREGMHITEGGCRFQESGKSGHTILFPNLSRDLEKAARHGELEEDSSPKGKDGTFMDNGNLVILLKQKPTSNISIVFFSTCKFLEAK
jgi:hypothetical protein